jgi:ribosomal protein S18 acetylase RimI-like enzyme
VSDRVSFRAFLESDADAVIALWDACGLLHPWNDPRKDITRKLTVQRDLFLVGERGGALVAAAMAGYDGHRGWIYYFAVAPSEQRRGVGRALLHEIEQRLRALGCPKINLQVRGDNARAVAFYERVGFSRDDTASLGKRLERDDPFPP